MEIKSVPIRAAAISNTNKQTLFISVGELTFRTTAAPYALSWYISTVSCSLTSDHAIFCKGPFWTVQKGVSRAISTLLCWGRAASIAQSGRVMPSSAFLSARLVHSRTISVLNCLNYAVSSAAHCFSFCLTVKTKDGTWSGTLMSVYLAIFGPDLGDTQHCAKSSSLVRFRISFLVSFVSSSDCNAAINLNMFFEMAWVALPRSQHSKCRCCSSCKRRGGSYAWYRALVWSLSLKLRIVKYPFWSMLVGLGDWVLSESHVQWTFFAVAAKIVWCSFSPVIWVWSPS